MKTPERTTLTAFPADWTAATDGPVSGEVVFAPLWNPGERPENSDLVEMAEQIEVYKERYRGKLGGKIIMIDDPVPFQLPAKSEQYRLDEEGAG